VDIASHADCAGNAYVVSLQASAGEAERAADGKLSFTVDSDTTRYIDLNDPSIRPRAGVNAERPQAIATPVMDTYVANFVSRNVSVVNLTNDGASRGRPTSDPPLRDRRGNESCRAEMFFFFTAISTHSGRTHCAIVFQRGLGKLCKFHSRADGRLVWQFTRARKTCL